MSAAARMPPLGPLVALALLGGVVLALALPVTAPWWLSASMLVLGACGWWHGVRQPVASPAPTGARQPGASQPAAGQTGAARTAAARTAAAWIPAAPIGAARMAAGVTSAGLVGVALAGLHMAHGLALRLPPEWEQRQVVLSGRVAELPQREPRRLRFEFEVDRGRAQPAALRGQTLRLAWYDEHGRPPPVLAAGERWRMAVRVRAPRGLRNPGGFDSERSALAGRVAATGYVRDGAGARRLAPARGAVAWRERMSRRIASDVPAASSRFVRALALGDTRALDDDDWSVLRADGLTHLIAISGFHVGLVAGFFALIARGLWWLWPGLGRRCPLPIAAAASGLGGGVLYAAASGMSLPTVRTVLMIAVVAGARAWRRPLRPVDALALAGASLLLVDPLSVLGAGFWLSFVGVAWLLWCLPTAGRRPLRDLLDAQWVATLGLLPLSVAVFGQASLAGPVANLLAVPWWSLVVVPLSLLGTGLEAVQAGAGAPLWRLAAWCFDLGWPLFRWLADTGLALWWLPEPRWFALPLALLGAFWLLLPRGVPGKALAILLWLPLLWPDRRLPAPGEAEVVVIDVGQGLSVLVRTAGHSLLYDMGPAVRDGFDAGERAVVPALRALGVRRLDRAVVSHADNDHAGGLAAVQRDFPTADLLAPEGAGVAAARACEEGAHWAWDGVHFDLLHPPRYFPYLGNEASCVLRVRSASGRVALLTGDIGEVIERDLVRRHAAALRADVVLVAHHGSGGSSGPALVAATGARHALVSTGHGNRFGHPRAEVLDRWRHAGAQTWDTAAEGALRIRLGRGPVQPESRRRAQPRQWDEAARSARARAGLSYRPD